VLRKSEKFSAAAGTLAAEIDAGGDGTADEAVGDSPKRRGGFAECCIRQGLSPVLMPLPGLAPVSPYFGMRPVGRLSIPK